MTDQTTPLVSVCIITYNHEKYIRDALDSVLAQETDFPFEIVIGEDNSTDSTRNIVLEYERNYPQNIRAVLSSTNLGPNRNLIRTMRECRGKYISMFEGDDLLTSTDKLQKQAAFFEEHQECTICFHKATIYIEANDKTRGLWPDFDPPTITTIVDMLQQNYIPPCSVMYRNVEIGILPERYYDLGIGDWPLHIIFAQKGNVGFLNKIMSQYRVHATGIFSSLTTIKKYEAVLKAREFIYPLLHKKHQKILGPVILDYYSQLALMNLENKDVNEAKNHLAKGMRYLRHFLFYKGWLVYFKLCIRVYFPRMYSLITNLKHRLLETH